MLKLKAYIKNELYELKNSIGKVEYTFWWILRFCMIGGTIYLIKTQPETYFIKLMLLNSLVMYAIPILRFLDFKKFFFGRMPFRLQSYLSVMVFCGSFLGHAVNMYQYFPGYDKFLHVVAGALVALMGYELSKELGGKNASVEMRIFFAQGLSFAAMVFWELGEFFSDFYIKDSCNQGFSYVPPEDFLFFKIFSKGKNDALQYPVFDTNIDLICAIIGSVGVGALLFLFIKLREKRRAAQNKGSDEKEKISVC